MNELDRKEYHSLILGALLHDIGKLLHRGDGNYHGSHEEASSQFIEKHREKLANDSLYDIDLVGLLVRHHDSKKSPRKVVFQEPYLSDRSVLERERVWRLVKMLRTADSYSCAERDHRPRWRGGTSKAPLDSVFANIHLTPPGPQEEMHARYHPTPLHPRKSFPDSFDAMSGKELNDLISSFEDNLPTFTDFHLFDAILNAWLDLIEEYTWAVPSDTRYALSDVSLFDHLRSTAAIAACLYKRHFLWLSGSKRDRTQEFMLVGGDFSGIQDYIFQITNRGSGGASKRLRARSLFIFAFSESVIHRILHALDLPAPCRLFSAGGKFLLLAPLTSGVEETLSRVKMQIDAHIHRTYFSQFSFLMSWMPINGFRERMETYTFFETADEMFHRREMEKQRKAAGILISSRTHSWDPSAFMARDLYDQYNESGDCKICGRGPATYTESDRVEEGADVKSCRHCYRDKNLLGERLPKSRYLAFGLTSATRVRDSEHIVTLRFQEEGAEEEICYYFRLMENNIACDDHYLVLGIAPGQARRAASRQNGIVTRQFANHVPVDKDGRTQTFEKIAEASERKENGATRGTALLGVLKADIDNLGLLFSKGFEHPIAQDESALKPVDRKTVSRFLTLSRMVELFQSGWIQDVLGGGSAGDLAEELAKFDAVIDRERLHHYLAKCAPNFTDVYTVYSGGDDMVLVGPWETMILFAFFLNVSFRRYTCHNNSITMSAGLAFVKPKHPIASAIRNADELLSLSKELGKNRITLFGRTAEWERLPELIGFFLFLHDKINDGESRIKQGFLHRLLSYHSMALMYIEKRKVTGLRYAPLLAYDIARNIVRREKADLESRVISGREEYTLLQGLINRRPVQGSLLHYLDIPILWASYSNREIKRQ